MADQGQIYDTADQFRAQLLANERAAASAMVRYYGEVWQRIQVELGSLFRDYATAKAAGRGAEWMQNFDRLTALKDQVEMEIARFAQYAEQSILTQQRAATLRAQADAEALTLRQLPQGINLQFNHLPAEAIENLVGFLGDGSPLKDLLGQLPGDAGEAVGRELISGLALGQNPRTIALAIRGALGGNLTRALRIARTEVLRSYREASRLSYENNAHLLKGWIWKSARSVRTCACCFAMDGTFHPLTERLAGHPQCRCYMVPVSKSWEELGFTGIEDTGAKQDLGVDVFERLSDEKKLKVLGPSKFKAYQDGKITLEDLVGLKQSKAWGPMHYEKSLRELGIDAWDLLKNDDNTDA